MLHAWLHARSDPVTIEGNIDGRVTLKSFFVPVAPNTFAELVMSSGIVFKPPIILKTRFPIMAKIIIKTAAPSRKFAFINATTIIGKKARTGIDWKISNNGRSIFSSLALPVIKRVNGILMISAIAYARDIRVSVFMEAIIILSADI